MLTTTLIWLPAALAQGLPAHLEQALNPPYVPPRASLTAPPAPDAGPDVVVYGFLPYWISDPLDAVAWGNLTHVALFDVGLEADGSISGTSFWDSKGAEAVARGAEHGVRVHLTVTSFEDSVMNAVLPDASRRARAVSELAALVSAAGAHGVSVDFEGMDSARKDDLVAFVAELDAAVDEVTVCTPAIDWQGAYDYDQLAAHSMGLFIMGYGYHWSGGDPGPVAPLFGGSPWSAYSLEWTVEDYRASGAPDDKIILGLPLYGRDWPTSSNAVPGSATGSGQAVVMTEAIDLAEGYGRQWDSVTHTPYAFPDASSQLWYDDTDSVRDRVAWIVEEGLLGTGFWALGYEGMDAGFWAMMSEETALDSGEGEGEEEEGVEGGPVARAGQEILAYVGQEVVLNGTASRGEDFTWSQASGPLEVSLRDADTLEPSFDAALEGIYRFSLVAGAGELLSEPDEVTVVVAATPPASCGGVGGASGAAALLALLGLLARRLPDRRQV
ncbi:MAG: hypothetical protein H6741_17570 [Alphaproteobacteria bacterium]|nr:hypothetical protein [Alphaproteobacteria bacterium]MCB9794528.1 hypothetical protein [Alphaproteobacteria bacterium]